MKVVHLIAGNINGGAARGAYWLHKGLLEQGIDSTIITSSELTLGEPEIIGILNEENKELYKNNLQSEKKILSEYSNKSAELFSTGLFGFKLKSLDKIKKSDIIHLHWVNDNFLDISELSLFNKPIIWTLRDMWPITGGCHYAINCERYKSKCGKCPLLGSEIESDLSEFVQQRKEDLLPKDIYYVGISKWITEQARLSQILRGKKVSTIANCIDTLEYFPIDKSQSRSILGINTPKKIILIGATRIKDSYKGFNLLKNVLGNLDKEKYFLAVFGAVNDADISQFGFEYKRFGYLYDTVSLRLVYSASDVFLCTSTLEAFGKTVAESMSCGTPVVCFDCCGPSEIVEHNTSGYKAKPYDTQDMVNGINHICFSPNYKDISSSANKRILNFFDKSKAAEKYAKLYLSIKSGSN
ncbi:hypothetical protein HR45_15480 [Shewanella mangrovi]|uniref:Glycosyl transferase family 1 domain-containing protein n=1 Tax=Shewanella mangrovi TaxID=1515746 RepID=A0A094JBA8_9GAMM|nr:hypothetical protein HR45_15480 [Shewanella mangrovi]